MKKLFSFFLMLILFLTGCSAEPPVPVLDFKGYITVDGSKAFDSLFDIEAEIHSSLQGAVTITVTTPDELWGLTYKWRDDFEMIYESLHVKTHKGYLPDEAFAQGIYNVLCSMSRQPECKDYSEGEAVFEGECPSGRFRVITDKKGYIQNISVKEINLSVSFSYE